MADTKQLFWAIRHGGSILCGTYLTKSDAVHELVHDLRDTDLPIRNGIGAWNPETKRHWAEMRKKGYEAIMVEVRPTTGYTP